MQYRNFSLKKKILLSICITTFNRSFYLKRLFKSIQDNYVKNVELIIIDDGSTDDTIEIVKFYKKYLNIIYKLQKNSGRGFALQKAIKIATGKFLIIVDSDDYFLKEGLRKIFNILSNNEKEINNNYNLCSYVFSTKTSKGINFVPDNIITNFNALRADYKIKGDLKEVVETKFVKQAIKNVNIKYRRFPTQLIWSYISLHIQCRCINQKVLFKEYLNEGLTSNILHNKISYPKPMISFYELVSDSQNYKSKIYRLKSKIFKYRYSIHDKSYEFLNSEFIYFLFGLIFAYIDKLILRLNYIYK